MSARGIAQPAPIVAPRNFTGYLTLVFILVVGLGYITANTDPARAGGLASVLVEYTAWVALAAVAMARSPGGILRVSDPYVMMLGLGFNFLMTPGVVWLQGGDLEPYFNEFGRIRLDIFIQLQWLHIIYMLAMSTAYMRLAPRHDFRPLDDAEAKALPSGNVAIALGLLPIALGIVQRVLTTGSILATQNYGEIWMNDHAENTAVHAEGGSALVAVQFIGKVWFLPWLALGIGEGLLLARLIRQRKTLPLFLFLLQVPVLLIVNSGGRSMVAAPFITALLIADLLVGPIRWRWTFSLASVGLVGFNFFGFYRAVRERDIGEAIAMANERFGASAGAESFSAESTGTLVKEHYGIAWTDAHNFTRGLSYFSESLLSLLPQQLLPEKVRFFNTGTFLAAEMLGSAAEAGGGVGGAMIVDGYTIGHEIGVIVLGAFVGALSATIARVLATGSRATGGRATLWGVALFMVWSQHAFLYFRGDLMAIESQVFSLLVLPAIFFGLLTRLVPTTRWRMTIPRS